MRFGVGNVEKDAKGVVSTRLEKGVLLVRRVRGYKGIKGRAITNGEIYVRWFEIAEDNPLFTRFVEKPVEVWNDIIAKVLGGIYEKEGFTKEQIRTTSVRLNIKAVVFEFETKDKRIFYYEFPQGLRRVVTPNKRFQQGLSELLRNAEKDEPIEEFPETNKEIRAMFTIEKVKAE